MLSHPNEICQVRVRISYLTRRRLIPTPCFSSPVPLSLAIAIHIPSTQSPVRSPTWSSNPPLFPLFIMIPRSARRPTGGQSRNLLGPMSLLFFTIFALILLWLVVTRSPSLELSLVLVREHGACNVMYGVTYAASLDIGTTYSCVR